MIVKTPGSQMGSPAAAEEGGEAMGGGRGKSGEMKRRGFRRKCGRIFFSNFRLFINE